MWKSASSPFSLDMSWLERCPGKKWVGWSTWPSTGVDPFRNASVEIFSFGDRSLWILLGVSWRGWQWDDVVTFTKFMQAMRHGHGWLARDMEFMRIGHQWPGEAGPWFGILLIMRFLNFFHRARDIGQATNMLCRVWIQVETVYFSCIQFIKNPGAVGFSEPSAKPCDRFWRQCNHLDLRSWVIFRPYLKRWSRLTDIS